MERNKDVFVEYDENLDVLHIYHKSMDDDSVEYNVIPVEDYEGFYEKRSKDNDELLGYQISEFKEKRFYKPFKFPFNGIDYQKDVKPFVDERFGDEWIRVGTITKDTTDEELEALAAALVEGME